jgi:hypothetical protein
VVSGEEGEAEQEEGEEEELDSQIYEENLEGHQSVRNDPQTPAAFLQSESPDKLGILKQETVTDRPDEEQ